MNTILKVDENLLDNQHTTAATILGKALQTGDFHHFDAMLNDNVETILYEFKSIIGKNQVLEYWKGWRNKWVVTKEVTEFEIKHINYYSNSALLMDSMLVLFMMNDAKISRMVLINRYISDEEDLVEDSPLGLEFIKQYIKPRGNTNNSKVSSVDKTNRLPCFSCGAKSEMLDWYSTDVLLGLHGDLGLVSICPKCKKVVEYVTEIRYRVESPADDE